MYICMYAYVYIQYLFLFDPCFEQQRFNECNQMIKLQKVSTSAHPFLSVGVEALSLHIHRAPHGWVGNKLEVSQLVVQIDVRQSPMQCKVMGKLQLEDAQELVLKVVELKLEVIQHLVCSLQQRVDGCHCRETYCLHLLEDLTTLLEVYTHLSQLLNGL